MRTISFFILSLVLALTSMVFASPGNIRSEDPSRFITRHSFDVLKYKLEVNLYACYQSPFPKSFIANEVITFKVDSALNSIQLNANNQSLTIDSVTMAGVSFTHLANILNILLDTTYQPGEVVSVRIYYKHKNVTDYGFFVSSGFVFTDSPPEGMRKWMPCWDRPSDKAVWELIAKVPVSVKLGSTGMLADSIISGDTLIYHWVSNSPVSTYLITITSSVNFQILTRYWHKLSDPTDSIPILLYHKPGENLKIIDSIIIPMTNFFSEKFGDYPFEKIGFATLNGSFPWGGMENQSMVNLKPGGYSDANLIAHEHSHQWFGDLITCGTWADIWLNEGFGTYCQNLWVEQTEGYEAYKNSMNLVANYYLAHNPSWPLYHPEWAVTTPNGNTLYNQAVTYNKGACVLFQLRYVLGDSIFFKVMHDYATDTNLMFKNAFTHDFVEKANEVSGENLDWFFDEWVYSPNHPVYQNTFDIDSIGEHLWRVSLILSQTQTNTVFFNMPVEIMVSFDDDTDTVIRVTNDANHQEFAFTFSKKPVNLIFDPYRNILLKKEATIYNIKKISGKQGFKLNQNDPNPFNNTTTVSYNLSSEETVTISIFDSNGRMLNCPVSRIHTPGSYRFEWSDPGLSPGTYLLKMEAGSFTETKKMVLTR
ncbi:MAG: M1 family aminopeptidase [Bacteroidales bacterium]|nr:M1 family aminopeptidase [Bacteroidales bacterium]